MMTLAQRRIIVPRLMDESNFNAQVLNAKSLLARFKDPHTSWVAPYYNDPHPPARANPRLRLIRLMRRNLWPYHMIAQYLRSADAIFYANKEWIDEWGLRLRSLTRRKIPLILTFEGIVGNAQRELMLSEFAGHPVHCFLADPAVVESTDQVYRQADHVIAISPFLQRVGEKLYGDKFSAIPLGIERHFTPPPFRSANARPVIVGAGSVTPRKRIATFVDLAALFPQADFVWYGDGPDVKALEASARDRGLANLTLAGKRSPAKLAEAFRAADIFVQPSWAEGVPKVVQEAAACGLPVVLFGFYEAPSVIHDVNGYVVWSEAELIQSIGALIDNPERRLQLGAEGAKLSKDWSWDVLAPQWEAKILEIVDLHARNRRRLFSRKGLLAQTYKIAKPFTT